MKKSLIFRTSSLLIPSFLCLSLFTNGCFSSSPKHTPLYSDLSYYMSELDDDTKTNFLAIYDGIQSFKSNIVLPVPVSSDDVSALMLLVANECPELIQLSTSWTEYLNMFDFVTSIEPEYSISKEIYDIHINEINALLNKWQNDFSEMSDYEFELSVYDYIIDSCFYSLDAPDAQNAYGALIRNQAKCDGRAKALVWALRSFGIKSSVVTGRSHAWVIAEIDGINYNVDPTYDDNEFDETQQPLYHAYFNVPWSDVSDDYSPVDDLYIQHGYPSGTKWDSNYHVKSGLWIPDEPYSDDDALIKAQQLFNIQADDILASSKSGTINIRFESASDYKNAIDVYEDWLQLFLDKRLCDCYFYSYDFSDKNIIALDIYFE